MRRTHIDGFGGSHIDSGSAYRLVVESILQKEGLFRTSLKVTVLER